MSEDVPGSTSILEEPPRTNPVVEDEVEKMFEDDFTIFSTLPSQTVFPFLIPSTSKVQNDFRLSSSLNELNIEDKGGDQGNQT